MVYSFKTRFPVFFEKNEDKSFLKHNMGN